MADTDVHLCMCCNLTIHGLDAYVQHKKFDCPAIIDKSNRAKPNSDATPAAPSSLFSSPIPVPHHPLDDFSLYDHADDGGGGLTAADLDNFFRCLELRSSKPKLPTAVVKSELMNLADSVIGSSSGGKDHVVDGMLLDDALFPSSIGIVEQCLNLRKFDLNDGGFYDGHSGALQLSSMLSGLEFDSEDSSNEFATSDTEDLLIFPEAESPSTLKRAETPGLALKNSSSALLIESQKLDPICEFESGNKVLTERIMDNLASNGMKASASKKSSGKSMPGKWRPGERPKVIAIRYTSRGKWQSPEGDDNDEDDEDNEEESGCNVNESVNLPPASLPDVENHIMKVQGIVNNRTSCVVDLDQPCEATQSVALVDQTENMQFSCAPCGRQFQFKSSLDRHLKTSLHIRRARLTADVSIPNPTESIVKHKPVVVVGENSLVPIADASLVCFLCKKGFYSKYSFARHIMSPFHVRRAAYAEKNGLPGGGTAAMPLGESFLLLLLRLRPFQCRCCEFYAHSAEQLRRHLSERRHMEVAGSLVGPLLCTRCCYESRDNDAMIAHVESAEHMRAVRESTWPCVLREKRTKVECVRCKKIVHSAEQLVAHGLSCRGSASALGFSLGGNKGKMVIKHPILNESAKVKGFTAARNLVEVPTGVNGTVKPSDSSVFTGKTRRKSMRKRKSASFLDDYVVEKRSKMKHDDDGKGDPDLKDTGSCSFAAYPPRSKEQLVKLESNAIAEVPDLSDFFCNQATSVASAESHGSDIRLENVTTEDAKKLLKTFEFRCKRCKVSFAKRSSYAKHCQTEEHIAKRPNVLNEKMPRFFCKRCSLTFADRANYVKHNRTPEHIAKRLSVREGETYRCRLCEYVTSARWEMRKHMRTPHGGVKLVCTICGVTFTNGVSYELHMLNRPHLNKLSESRLPGAVARECELCGRKFYDEARMRMHEINHGLAEARKKNEERNAVNAMRDEEGEVGNLDPFVQKDPGVRIACTVCDKMLTPFGMRYHMRQHTGKLPHSCPCCGKAFADPSIMRRHLRGHLGIRLHRCQHCVRTFDRRFELDVHVERTHSDMVKVEVARPHLCNVCGARFIKGFQLRVHEKVHNKTVRCTQEGCKKLFTHVSEMLMHVATHSTLRHYLCDECGYAGKSKNQLNRHRRIHSGEKRYACSQCSYRSVLVSNMRRHQIVHAKTKPFGCPYCNYTCNITENLRKHILKSKSHEGKFVYPCKLCPFGTNSFTEFQEHVESTHDVDSALKKSASVYNPHRIETVA